MISAISSYMDPSLMSTSTTQVQRVNPFNKADTNGDGFLDSTELSTVAGKISEMTGETTDADQMMADLDSDGDGKLSEEEFEAGRPDGPPSPPGGMMGMMGTEGTQSLLDILNESEDEDSTSSTDSLDLNGDGVVDAEEALLGIQGILQGYLSQILDASAGEVSGSQVSLAV